MPQFGEYPTILKYTLDNMREILCQNSKKIILRPSREWTDEFLDWSKGWTTDQEEWLKIKIGKF